VLSILLALTYLYPADRNKHRHQYGRHRQCQRADDWNATRGDAETVYSLHFYK
jgi:hypothetical protein